MSYRAFKRLLGETSLERKCHFLFGGFILVLITGSFWLYARQTESLAYEQITTACRLLAVQIVVGRWLIPGQRQEISDSEIARRFRRNRSQRFLKFSI